MRTRTREDFDALLFDLEISIAQRAQLAGEQDAFEEVKEKILEKAKQLPPTLDVVREHEDVLRRISTPAFWNDADWSKLESLRNQISGIMRFREKTRRAGIIHLDLDDAIRIRDQIEFGPERERASVEEYRRRVEERFAQVIRENPELERIANGLPIAESDLHGLALYLRSLDLEITEENLKCAYDNRAASFLQLIRKAIGLEELPERTKTISDEFDSFIVIHNDFSSDQVGFVMTLKTFLIQRGGAEKRDLVNAPFTHFHRDGIRGLFQPSQIDEIIGLIDRIRGIRA
ncbi:MAG: hypothetical protein COC22_03310 [Flavobacteriaceae bacterium]|nr:MAG: hypothetical protein COC22_03310 [Flavobacteriaceae bacterium]